MRTWLFVAGLFCVLGFPVPTAGQSPDPSPELVIEIQPAHLQVMGVVSSVAHESILRATAARMFATRTAEFDIEIQVPLPPGWALVTDLTFQALAETRSAMATINSNGITIRGFSTDAGRWSAAAKRIESVMPDGWTFHQQVEEIASASSIHRQCIELFRTALRGRKIEFERASAELGTATGPLLDELIQITADCPESLVDITGHTDNTGAASVNLALSQARADAVAEYLISGGIPQERVSARGVGSAEPLTEENSAQARRLNRRIDVVLRFP